MFYNITEIHAHYAEIARLRACGMTIGQIASRLNKSTVMVGYVVNNPLMKREIERLQAGRDSSAMDLGKTIDELAPKALAYINQVIDGIKVDPETGEEMTDPNTGKPLIHTDDLRYKASKDLLGMAGHGPVQRVKATVTHGIFTPEDIERFKQRAREAGIIRIPAETETLSHDAVGTTVETPLSQYNAELIEV